MPGEARNKAIIATDNSNTKRLSMEASPLVAFSSIGHVIDRAWGVKGRVNRRWRFRGEMDVILEWYEVHAAFRVGWLRHDSSWGKHNDYLSGEKAEPDDDPDRDFWKNFHAAAAELAVAKAYNRYWHGSVNRFHEIADVGFGIGVRWIEKDTHRLIVREKDEDWHEFVLVSGEIIPIHNIRRKPSRFRARMRIHGHLRGDKCKQDRWWEDPNDRKRPAYLVPQRFLDPPEIEPLEITEEDLVGW
jgi:hypothetical protein